MEKKKAPTVVSDINVTPMVDVMLVLLIIFMVITPLLTKGQTVELVRTNPYIRVRRPAKKRRSVAVTRNGGFSEPTPRLLRICPAKCGTC